MEGGRRGEGRGAARCVDEGRVRVRVRRTRGGRRGAHATPAAIEPKKLRLAVLSPKNAGTRSSNHSDSWLMPIPKSTSRSARGAMP